MTRKEFLKEMISSIFGISAIEFKNTNEDKVYYTKGGSLLKDCTYTNKYKDRITMLVCCIFKPNIKKVEIDTKTYEVEQFKINVKNFVITNALTSNSDITEKHIYDMLNQTNDVDLCYIYKNIIIKEIFNISGDSKKGSKEYGKDNFEESKEKISSKLIEFISQYSENKPLSDYLQAVFPEMLSSSEQDEFLKRKEAFMKHLSSKPTANEEEPSNNIDIYYKCGTFIRNKMNIELYVNKFNKRIVDLNENKIDSFEPDVVYELRSLCYFEEDATGIRPMIKVKTEYNDETLVFYTSEKNWIELSFVSNYMHNNFTNQYYGKLYIENGNLLQFDR